MAYSQSVLQRARERLELERQAHEEEAARRIEQIYTQLPRLREIDAALRKTMAKITAATFRNGADPSEAIAKIREENLALQREREWLLASHDLEESDVNPAPFCPECGGSGYRGAVMCTCLREILRQEQKKELSSLFGAGKESFDTFRLEYYSDEFDPNLGASPRALMHHVHNRCVRYAKTFSASSPSLLFAGATGLGKTFLSACIARAVADRGFSVVYTTAGQAFSDFEQAKFGGGDSHALTDKYLQCDLLILDDLGTEMTTQFVVSALYAIVNGRLLAHLPTIASTNVPVYELERRYSAQIASRLLGCYELCKFYGSDIRMRPKR